MAEVCGAGFSLLLGDAQTALEWCLVCWQCLRAALHTLSRLWRLHQRPPLLRFLSGDKGLTLCLRTDAFTTIVNPCKGERMIDLLFCYFRFSTLKDENLK